MRQDPTFETAREIAEHVLDVTGTAIMSGQVAPFVDRFDLPVTIGTFDSSQTLTSPADVERMFDAVQRYLRSQGIDQMIRRVVVAEAKATDFVAVTHESRYLSKGHAVQEPVLSHGYIKHLDGLWKISNENHYAFQKAPLLSHALSGAPLDQCFAHAGPSMQSAVSPHPNSLTSSAREDI